MSEQAWLKEKASSAIRRCKKLWKFVGLRRAGRKTGKVPIRLHNPYSDENIPASDNIDYTDELFLPRGSLHELGFQARHPIYQIKHSSSVNATVPSSNGGLYYEVARQLADEALTRVHEFLDLGIWDETDVSGLKASELPRRPARKWVDEEADEKLPEGSVWEVCLPHNDFEQDQLGLWPRRLLHVPTMTSLEWQPGNMYGQYQSPLYAAISYTWGRWKLDDGQCPEIEALPVMGTTWPIPRVNEDLFAVEQFREAITYCVSSTVSGPQLEFIWLDVACINQTPGNRIGMLEIGRQAKIFQQAQRVFIWLIGLSRKDAFWHTPEACLAAFSHAADVPDKLLDDITRQRHLFGMMFRSPHQDLSSADQTQRISVISGYEGCIHEASSGLARLADLPWFSSLWTLQEAFLRPDAIYLNSRGNPIALAGHEDEVIRLRDCLSLCVRLQQICRGSVDIKRRTGQPITIQEQGLLRVVDRSGLAALGSRNPIALYTSAQARTTIRPLDRVYGIMQVFGFQLGASSPNADPSHTWTLEELEVQLGTELLYRLPILSQLHVHERRVSNRQAWRVSSSSAVPGLARDLPFTDVGSFAGETVLQSHLSVRRAGETTYGHFSGHSCPFATLQELWMSFDRQNQTHPSDEESVVQIALDSTVILNKATLKTPYSLHEIPPTSQQHELGSFIVKKIEDHGLEICVWLLGRLKYELNTSTRRTNENSSLSVEQYVGIIVLKSYDQMIGTWWKRLGICIWHRVPSSVLDNMTNVWTISEGVFG